MLGCTNTYEVSLASQVPTSVLPASSERFGNLPSSKQMIQNGNKLVPTPHLNSFMPPPPPQQQELVDLEQTAKDR